MPLQDEETPRAAPSLIDRLRVPWMGGRALRWAALALLAVLAMVAIVAGLLARRARHEAIALGDVVARAAAAREADRAIARLFGRPTLDDELAALAAHLPPETKLALAHADDGRLTIAIDSADPDALRETLRADRWFAGFRERGQAMGENGVIRVTLERAP